MVQFCGLHSLAANFRGALMSLGTGENPALHPQGTTYYHISSRMYTLGALWGSIRLILHRNNNSSNDSIVNIVGTEERVVNLGPGFSGGFVGIDKIMHEIYGIESVL